MHLLNFFHIYENQAKLKSTLILKVRVFDLLVSRVPHFNFKELETPNGYDKYDYFVYCYYCYFFWQISKWLNRIKRLK